MDNPTLTLPEVIEAVCARLDIRDNARIVGKWVWVTYDTPPSFDTRAELKRLGFRWNHRRQCWQHNCGHTCLRSNNDPRYRYGQVLVSELKRELGQEPRVSA